MRRPLLRLGSSLLAFTLLIVPFASMPLVAAGTIAPTTTCSNGVDDTPGLGLICDVTISNTITGSGGTATVTIHECHGPAGDPNAACTDTTDTLTEPVTQVTQCNASTNGGGGTLRCSVHITNHFVGISPSTGAVTIDQCVGSGDDIANTCDPFPATTSGADVTQCNGSANGGTLVELTCTATGESAAGHGVSVDQCNGSTNGGGALVICSVTIANTFAASPTPTPTPRPTARPTPTSRPTARPTPKPGQEAVQDASTDGTGTGSTAPPTDEAAFAGAAEGGTDPTVLVALMLGTGVVILLASTNRRGAAGRRR